MSWIADLVQVLEEFPEPILLQPKIHLQRVIRGRSPDFNPAFGNASPFVLYLHLLPTFIEIEWVRDNRLQGAKQSNDPKYTRHHRKGRS